MYRFKYLLLLSLIAGLIIAGCASDEEKKAIHFEKGKSYFEKGDFKSARLEFINAIQMPT
jgi:Tfp pilus assembly protein PilF